MKNEKASGEGSQSKWKDTIHLRFKSYQKKYDGSMFKKFAQTHPNYIVRRLAHSLHRRAQQAENERRAR